VTSRATKHRANVFQVLGIRTASVSQSGKLILEIQVDLRPSPVSRFDEMCSFSDDMVDTGARLASRSCTDSDTSSHEA
jgi:hypothetical protein